MGNRNTNIFLGLLILAFIALMVIVWSDIVSGPQLYGYEPSYWLGLTVGVNAMLIINTLSEMKKKKNNSM